MHREACVDRHLQKTNDKHCCGAEHSESAATRQYKSAHMNDGKDGWGDVPSICWCPFPL